ncbi:MAG: hypothetical protein D6675_07960 [Gemmatimonadetes bacterium]|nr:MAG: hypothetical protein D6675_07960 [Gemmatimonadota bacterium]
MKLVALMALAKDMDCIKRVFQDHHVQIYSEVEITGHTFATLKQYGWFSKRDIPTYSSLCFALVPADVAQVVMDEVEQLQQENPSDHPVHGFVIDVEKMI